MHAVMLEEAGQERFKTLIKKADYLSADFECLRNIIAGSLDAYFKEVVARDLEGSRLSPVFHEALKVIAEENAF